MSIRNEWVVRPRSPRRPSSSHSLAFALLGWLIVAFLLRPPQTLALPPSISAMVFRINENESGREESAPIVTKKNDGSLPESGVTNSTKSATSSTNSNSTSSRIRDQPSERVMDKHFRSADGKLTEMQCDETHMGGGYRVSSDLRDRGPLGGVGIMTYRHTSIVPNIEIAIYESKAGQGVHNNDAENPEESASHEIATKGCYECDLVRTVIDRLRSYPNAVFLDIGSRLGIYALTAAKLGRAVFAFESTFPDRIRLCKSIQLNKLQDKLHLFDTSQIIGSNGRTLHEARLIRMPTSNKLKRLGGKNALPRRMRHLSGARRRSAESRLSNSLSRNRRNKRLGGNSKRREGLSEMSGPGNTTSHLGLHNYLNEINKYYKGIWSNELVIHLDLGKAECEALFGMQRHGLQRLLETYSHALIRFGLMHWSWDNPGDFQSGKETNAGMSRRRRCGYQEATLMVKFLLSKGFMPRGQRGGFLDPENPESWMGSDHILWETAESRDKHLVLEGLRKINAKTRFRSSSYPNLSGPGGAPIENRISNARKRTSIQNHMGGYH